jgi:curved DNA-binding protein CbpA
MSTYYELLEIAENAAEVEIKKAYRRMAKLWHPDMNLEKDTTQKFISIEVAYSALSDRKSRAAYDRLLRMEREHIINPGLNRKYAQTVTKRTSQSRSRANSHSKMSYEQYQREEKLRTSLRGMFLKAAFFLVTAALVFWLLTYFAETREAQIRARQEPTISDTLFVIIFFLPLPLLIGLTYAYEPLVKFFIVGRPKGKRKKKK